jgi:hypothetical protein
MLTPKRLRHHITRRRLNPPLGFVHIPKAAGTTVVNNLESLLRPRRLIYGLDRSQFGSFSAFETLSAATRGAIFDQENAMPGGADLIAGHLAPGTIHRQYPTARLMTILRAPTSRLLSHWFYWRGYDADVRAQYGAWGEAIAHAQNDLAAFLQARQIACVTDNILVRMLLWPHPLIPSDDFIDPRHDDRLLADATRALGMFSFVYIIEAPAMLQAIETWLRLTYGYSFWARVERARQGRPPEAINASKRPVAKVTTPLSAQLASGAADQMQRSTRLDDCLWREIAARHIGESAVSDVYARSVASSIERYERLTANP